MVVRAAKGCRRSCSGVLALRVLTDTPEQADWLPPDQRDVAGRDAAPRAGATRVAHHERVAAAHALRAAACGS